MLTIFTFYQPQNGEVIVWQLLVYFFREMQYMKKQVHRPAK